MWTSPAPPRRPPRSGRPAAGPGSAGPRWPGWPRRWTRRTGWCTRRRPAWPPIPGSPCRPGRCGRDCGWPTSSTGRCIPNCCGPPARLAAAPSTAGRWPSSRPRTPSGCSPGTSPTPAGCSPTSTGSRRRRPAMPMGADLPRRRAIATVCLSGTLADRLDAAAAAGFDGVEIFENDLIASAGTAAGIRSRAAGLGLSIELYQPFRDAEGAPPDRFRSVVRRMTAKLDLAAELGAPMVLVCSSVAPDTIDDVGLAAGQLRVLADLAAERGLRIAYEAL